MKYAVTSIVDAAKLGDYIKAVTPFGHALKVDPIEEEESPRRVVKRTSVPVDEQRLGSCIVKALETGPCSVGELQSHIMGHGYSATSLSPTLTKLTREDRVERLGEHNGQKGAFYALVPPVANGQLRV